MKTIENLQRCIKDANHIVAILGIEMLVESGGSNFDSNEESYRMEEKYGVCPEELLSGSFYCAKKEQFYKFYKKEMLGMSIGATAGYEALYKLQQQGKLHTVINQNYHPIPEPYHFARVIELNGNIQHYHCTKCHKTYDASYILQCTLGIFFKRSILAIFPIYRNVIRPKYYFHRKSISPKSGQTLLFTMKFSKLCLFSFNKDWHIIKERV